MKMAALISMAPLTNIAPLKLLFLLSLAVILYTYAGYPMAIALLARLRPRLWKRAPWPHSRHTPQGWDRISWGVPCRDRQPWSRPAPASPRPPISIIMAVHNGAAMLPAKIAHLLALDPALVYEIIVISDGSTDQTNNIIRQTSDPRLHTIEIRDQVGKAAALNYGIMSATGEILLFVDIRPFIEPDALVSLLSNFADSRVGCVAGELILKTTAHDAACSAVSGLYWRYEQWIRTCEATLDSPVGVYGGFYAVRRSLATKAPEGLILDDMFQPLSIIRKGYRSVIDRNATVTDTWPAQASGEFQRKVRTLAGNFQLIARAPWILSSQNRAVIQLISHKLLRLAVPYFFALLLITSAMLGRHSAPYAVFAVMQAAVWLLAALALKVRIPILHRVAGPASALLVLNAAAVAGLYTFLFTQGPLWKIWTPTAPPELTPAGT